MWLVRHNNILYLQSRPSWWVLPDMHQNATCSYQKRMFMRIINAIQALFSVEVLASTFYQTLSSDMIIHVPHSVWKKKKVLLFTVLCCSFTFLNACRVFAAFVLIGHRAAHLWLLTEVDLMDCDSFVVKSGLYGCLKSLKMLEVVQFYCGRSAWTLAMSFLNTTGLVSTPCEPKTCTLSLFFFFQIADRDVT